jgi:hypothetical protein
MSLSFSVSYENICSKQDLAPQDNPTLQTVSLFAALTRITDKGDIPQRRERHINRVCKR